MLKNRDDRGTKGFLSSPVSGKTVSLEDTGDDIFSKKIIGDGIAVSPTEGIFLSPCNGTVAGVAGTAHSYNIFSDDGLDVLVHIGIGTSKLGGEGFSPSVKVGDKVRRGQILCTADISLISDKGYSTLTPVIISNISDISFFGRKKGDVIGGEKLIDYII